MTREQKNAMKVIQRQCQIAEAGFAVARATADLISDFEARCKAKSRVDRAVRRCVQSLPKGSGR